MADDNALPAIPPAPKKRVGKPLRTLGIDEPTESGSARNLSQSTGPLVSPEQTSKEMDRMYRSGELKRSLDSEKRGKRTPLRFRGMSKR